VFLMYSRRDALGGGLHVTETSALKQQWHLSAQSEFCEEFSAYSFSISNACRIPGSG